MSNAERKLRICNRVSALLMALVLVCQFVPFWHYGEGDAQTASINGYVWFPSDYAELTAKLTAEDEAFNINDILPVTVILLILCVVGVIMGLWKSDSLLPALLAVITGALGCAGYLTSPVMRMGSLWGVHVLLLALIFLAGAAALVSELRRKE